MAKNTTSRSGISKVRLIVFEAEVADGDLSQVTHVLQNAFKSSSPASKVIYASPAQTSLGNGVADEVVEVESQSEFDEPVIPPKPRTPRKPRVAKTPTVLDDLDFQSEPSLKEFVAGFDLNTSVDKYLVIALWFRDARAISTISVDHVYTAFKMLTWSTSSNDFSKPLKNLRQDQAFKGGNREGWALTLPGAGKIEAKKRSV